MDAIVVLVALVVMLVGLAGTVLPVLPGLSLIWLGAVGSMVASGWSAGAWIVAALVTGVLVAAQVAQYALPARAGRGAGAPRTSLVAGVALGVVGFFVIPFLGFLVGGVAGVYLAERSRLGSHDAAWRTTWAVVRSVGVSALVQVLAGLLVIAVWLGYVLL